MKHPFLPQPLLDDLDSYLDSVELAYASGVMSSQLYHIAIGKALAYVECRYSLGLIGKDKTLEFISSIEFNFLEDDIF